MICIGIKKAQWKARHGRWEVYSAADRIALVRDDERHSGTGQCNVHGVEVNIKETKRQNGTRIFFESKVCG